MFLASGLRWVLEVTQNSVSCVINVFAARAHATTINIQTQNIPHLMLNSLVLREGLCSCKGRSRFTAHFTFEGERIATFMLACPLIQAGMRIK